MSTLNGHEPTEPEPAAPQPTLPCSYPAHRSTDWRLAEGGPTVCGICHTAPPGLAIEHVVQSNDAGHPAETE